MSDLRSSDFGSYFEAVHERSPFPWQARLASSVIHDGQWPALLDLPTGTGKTATLDIAIFHLAVDASRAAAERVAPRRIVLVVDRRTVVDQGFDRARRIAHKLESATGGVLKDVADALRSLTGDSESRPLALAQLRGGMPRDDGWARRPDQPLIAVSTVDQVGSRLFFRGYGVSESMRPIHAGLLGNDTLFLLDEVHLSQPFLESLRGVGHHRQAGAAPLPARWQAVAMSATPGADVGFELDSDDLADARMAQRLDARKPVELEEVRVTGDEEARREMFGQRCAIRAEGFATPGRAVGVMVNRVATAHVTYRSLAKRFGDKARVFLVTGRMRPLDRDDLDALLTPLVRSERMRDGTAPPIIVVSTQCLEAGADFDFDALVTECATLDALRQRFGRLNRLGEISDARGVVLVRADALSRTGEEDDPVYGPALAATWRWLSAEPRDFGVQALKLPEPAERTSLLSPRGRAPVLLPAHLDAWAQTKPPPRPDPDVSLWLHGVDHERSPDVSVVWRDDILESHLLAVESDVRLLAPLLDRVEACPPLGLEAVAVPIYAVKAWLASSAPSDDYAQAANEVADVESGTPEVESRISTAHDRCALVWEGDASRVVRGANVQPGMTLVVPSAYGGLQRGNWDGSSTAPVADLGDRARWQKTRRPLLRLTRDLPSQGLPAFPGIRDDAENVDLDAAIGEWLAAAATAMASPDATSPQWLRDCVTDLGRSRRRVTIYLDALEEGDGVRIAVPAYLLVAGKARGHDAGGEVTTEDDTSSYTGIEVTLTEHMSGVAGWARKFAENCGFPDATVRALEVAGRWHDAGKVDPRFQRLLHGGSEYRTIVAPEPIAKSAQPANDRAGRELALTLSRYPRGARHELSSVSLLLQVSTVFDADLDRDLVLHLVASHHGWCRPFAPVVADAEPVELALDIAGSRAIASSDHGLEQLDSGVAERFWTLVARYGWYGLAWLEATLRLADHRRSEEEQRRDERQEAP